MTAMFDDDSGLWDRTNTDLPPRSRLFHLEPAGLGTGFVESLTSYSARLAAAHNVTHASLFGREISPLIDRKHLRNSESRLDKGAILTASFRTLARAVNGTGVTARDYARALEKLTGWENLHCLTMGTWIDVIPHRNLLKPSKAWCPSCYQEFKLKGMRVFEPLLWSLSVITSCVHHRLRLCSRCPRCDCPLLHLDSHSRPGFCCKCGIWLGRSAAEGDQSAEDIVGKELDWQTWVTEQLSILLASTPLIEVTPKKEAVTGLITFCIKNIAHMTEACFARTLGVPQSTVNDWQRQGNMPGLEKLLRIAYFTRIPLLNLLLGIASTQRTPNEVVVTRREQKESETFRRPYKKRTRVDIEKSKNALESALAAETPPK